MVRIGTVSSDGLHRYVRLYRGKTLTLFLEKFVAFVHFVLWGLDPFI